MAYCQHAHQRQLCPRNLASAARATHAWKIVLLAAYSVTLFLVRSWAGIALCALLFAAVAAASRVPIRRFFGLLVPVYVIVAFTVLFNGFSFDVSQAVVEAPAALGDVSAGIFATWAPVPLIGSFGLVPAGLARGCFFALRIAAGGGQPSCHLHHHVHRLMNALGDFLRLLKRIGVPSDDIAMVFSLALRFIPVTAEEFGRVHDAQWARGASFAEGSLWERLRAWQTVLIPLFVGLFRRADSLAVAMDASCYGAPDAECTSFAPRAFSLSSGAVLAAGLAACAGMAVWL